MSEQPVVVGVDASAAALSAVRWAAREAARHGRRLMLFHACVFDGDPPRHGLFEESELLLEHIYRWLRHAAAIARTEAPGVEVEHVVRLGLAADLLVAASAEAPLLVLGSHGIGGLRGALIGSVALRVAAEAHCPVVVVRGHTEPDGPVVAGLDPAIPSEPVLRFAAEAAAARDVRLVVVRAWHDGVLNSAAELVALTAKEELGLEGQVVGLPREYPGLQLTSAVVQDRKPARALLHAAPAPQLIVVGSRGRGPIAGGVLGSTGNDLLAHATCPVAVVH